MSLILSGTDGLSDVDGSASTPAIRGTDTNTGIFFPAADTIAFAEGGAEVMRINSSGNVGIGTSNPVSPANTTALTIYNASESRIALQNSTSGTAETDGASLAINGSDFYITNREAGNQLFFNNGSERMRIDSSGNLLVGRTSQIDFSKFALSYSGATNNGIIFDDTTASGTSSACIFKRAGTNVGAINTTASATSYVTSSDYRLKENIAPMTGALAKVSALKPVTYKWKVDGSDGQGFIAHELAEVCPDAVIGEKDAVDADGNPQYQGIDTSFLVATLTAAIQEQQAIITDLKSRIEALEVK